MYMYYQGWLWTKSLNSDHVNKPVQLSSFISGLPDESITLYASYINPNGELIIHANNFIHTYIPSGGSSFKLVRKIEDVRMLSSNFIPMGATTTYTGQTFIFYAENYYEQWGLNESDKIYGSTSARFNGLPSSFHGIFRYTNGLLYIFDNDSYYEYDEFRNILVRSYKRDISVFNINCISKSLLQQLQTVIAKFL